jgi:hypothetical protein
MEQLPCCWICTSGCGADDVMGVAASEALYLEDADEEIIRYVLRCSECGHHEAQLLRPDLELIEG